MAAPDEAAARAGLEAARHAAAEADRALEEREAARPSDDGDGPSGWFFRRRRADDTAWSAVPARTSRGGGSRMLLGAASASVFVALGAVVFSNWDGLMTRLARTPVPREAGVAFSSLPAARVEDQTIAAARRHLDAGDPARAVALLDSVSPEQPAYPFARQLRVQAERALRDSGARR